MFERFTDGARRVMVLAQEEAHTLNHGFIGTGHLLLGLIRHQDGTAARALRSLGITLEDAREQVVVSVGPVQYSPLGSPPFTPEAKSALEFSLREALQFGAKGDIDTEHLLLGILDEQDGGGSALMVALGVTGSQVRSTVIDLMGGLPSGYRQPTPGDRRPGRRGPANHFVRLMDEGELDPAAWGVLLWRQDHLPLAVLRNRKDWESLQMLEMEAVDRVYGRLDAHSGQWLSLREHHARRVHDRAHEARPDLVPEPFPSRTAHAPQTGTQLYAVSRPVGRGRRLRYRLSFLSGWACWFGNRWAGMKSRWRWVQTRRFALRTRAAYRGQPRPS